MSDAVAVSERQLLSMYDSAAEALLAEVEDAAVRQRLWLLGKVLPAARWPGQAPWGLTPSAAAVVTFLAQARRSGRADAEWAAAAVRSAGIDPLVLISVATTVPFGMGSGPYLGPVTDFHADLHRYRLVAVSELPFSFSLKCCAEPERCALERSAVRKARLRGLTWTLDRPQRLAAEQAAGRELQRRVNEGAVRCGLHDARPDWDLLARDAERIHASVRPWVSTEVWRACSPTRGEDLDPHTQMLRELFLEPVQWSPGDWRLTNGQHRVCRAREQGAEQLMVATSR